MQYQLTVTTLNTVLIYLYSTYFLVAIISFQNFDPCYRLMKVLLNYLGLKWGPTAYAVVVATHPPSTAEYSSKMSVADMCNDF